MARRFSIFGVLTLGLFLSNVASAQLIISEFRVRGPNGANDEFIEIYNNSGTDHTVAAISGSGYGVAASDGTTRCSIPNGTVIPNAGHYLCVNSVGYSLASYPAGNGTTATGDATYVTDIPDNAGIAIFNNNSGGGSYSLANRLDAVGSTSEANVLYKEGTGYPALVPFSIDYAFYRDTCGKGGSITTFGPCPIDTPKDTNNNAADFVFVDTNGTSAGAGQRLGSPGPENLSSPIHAGSPIADIALDPCVADTALPNTDYDGASDPPENATFGTLTFRRTFTNNTGSAITRMRFRIIDQTTFPAPTGFADMRSHTVASENVIVDRAPCGSGTSSVLVQGTTLEEPPNQPNGGAFNGSFSVGTITLGTPLANGASIDLAFLFGLQQHGQYKMGIIVETLPDGGDSVFEIEGCTDGCTGEPEVVNTEPVTTPVSAGLRNFRVAFNEGVTGVDTGDFVLTTTGTIAGATITGVVAENSFTYVVTVNTGTGTGTIRLDVVDNNTITGGGDPLGGPAAGDGNFTAGEPLVVIDPPEVVSITRADSNPAIQGSVVDFLVTFSESVTGVDTSDFALTTTGTLAGFSITGVSGAGATRTVSVNVGLGTGTIRLDVVDDDTIIDADSEPLGGPGSGNGDFTTGQAYDVIAAAAALGVPALDPRMLALLAVLLGAVAVLVTRRV